MKLKRAIPTLAAIFGAITLGIIPASSATPTLPDPAVPVVFRDLGGARSIAVQLQSGRPDTGSYDFYVVNLGDYSGQATLRTVAPNIVHVDSVGPATFYRDSDGSATTVSVNLEGVIDTGHVSGAFLLTVGSKYYTVLTRVGSAENARLTAAHALTALAARDWASIYSLLAPEVLNGVSQSVFVGRMQAAPQATIVSAAATDQGQVTTVGGWQYFKQSITVTVRRPDGTTYNYASAVTLVLESSGWRLIATNPAP